MKKQILSKLFIFNVFIILFAGIAPLKTMAQEGKFQIIEVAENRAFCESVVPKKCLQVRKQGEKEFRLFHDEIENFAFVPGYRYVLRVEVEKMRIIPKDTSGYKYFLKEIISREKVENSDLNAGLYLNKWNLTTIDGKSVKGERAYLRFNKTDEKVFGNTGCNGLGGKFEIVENSIKLSELITTKRACPNTREVENPFLRNLSEAETFKVETDRLYFYKNGRVILVFEPEN